MAAIVALRGPALVETIIAKIAGEFISRIVEVITEGGTLAKVEEAALRETKACAARMMETYAAEIDAAMVADRVGRQEAGYSIERRGDERRIQTLVGEVSYRRTYFQKVSGGYEYLTDTVLGVNKRERVSESLSLALVREAKDISNGKASVYLTAGGISRQTVMGKLRGSYAQKPSPGPRRWVSELHIDADEAHITLRNGRKSEVPLISVYEGIVEDGKRRSCKDAFHISEYGKTSDDIWEQALTEVEARYELTGTNIYLHGDGASWIQKGLEWFPGSIFVLDKYHKNKAIKNMTAGLPQAERKVFDTAIRESLAMEDIACFDRLTLRLCDALPQRYKPILGNAGYLTKHIAGISICAKDPSANNGGCTEPHVSHVLSARLSSRPMAWSKRTLTQLAPMLAGGDICKTPSATHSLPVPLQGAAASARQAFHKSTAGLPVPDAIGTLPLSGKVTGTQKLLKLFA
jgi:hypothetical protein